MDPQFDNVKEIVEIRRGMGVAISEANKIVGKFLKPWELLRQEGVISLIGMDKAEMLSKVMALAKSSVIPYSVYDPATGTAPEVELAGGEDEEAYLVDKNGNMTMIGGILRDSEISKDLTEMAKMSIDMYVREAKKSIALEGEWDEYTKIENMTPEQERKMKEGYRRK